ncbi:hypothetical protein GJAV_G00224390 [Gymnothorax javanicus]|nr:hypothetical protein GJAV_G00224390 [Gymnothorax javanicus]
MAPRVQQEQLAAIFQLLRENQETFGEVTEGDVAEQLKLLASVGAGVPCRLPAIPEDPSKISLTPKLLFSLLPEAEEASWAGSATN